jgi:hypothetical protein
MSTATIVRFPETPRGPRTAATQAKIDAFVEWLLNFRSRLDFTPGKRGWCYMLENQSIVSKGAFGRLEYFIDERRKDGSLPLDFCSEDDKRAVENSENLDTDTPKEYAESYATIAADSWETYTQIIFCAYQLYYIEMVVEKVDLKELFKKVCAEYHVPIWNAGGWSDINSRANLLKRFREHVRAGRRCVLLYCGDFDPAGFHISNLIYKNLKRLKGAVGWFPADGQLIIDRFGLNIDFIEAYGLTWIEGLETGSGKNLADEDHKDHWKTYVQDYMKLCKERKVEANALVAHYEAGRQLCRNAIEKYIDPAGIKRYEKALKRERLKVKQELPAALKAALDGTSGGNGKA